MKKKLSLILALVCASLIIAWALIMSVSCSMTQAQWDKACQERRDLYIAKHPRLSDFIKSHIATGDLAIGMTRSQVIASIGKPFEINKSTYSWGTTEQWRYKYYSTLADIHYEFAYVYFKNGRVESWQSD